MSRRRPLDAPALRSRHAPGLTLERREPGPPEPRGRSYEEVLGIIGGTGDRAVGDTRDLDGSDAFALFAAMLADEVPALELGAILTALRIKGESLDETIAFMRALDPHVARLPPPSDAVVPVVIAAGGGTRRRANLTPLVAMLLRRYDVPVLVHGPDDTRGAPSPQVVSTREVLFELGIEPARTLEDAWRQLARQRIAYVPTATLAPPLGPLLAYWARLGAGSLVHALSRVIDPFHGDSYRVLAVDDSREFDRMREFLVATKARAMLLAGSEGEPFADPQQHDGRIAVFSGGRVVDCAGEARDDPSPVAASMSASNDAALATPTDAASTAQWIARALAGTAAVPASIVAQLACCLHGTRRRALPATAIP